MRGEDWRIHAVTELAEDWLCPWSSQTFPKGSKIIGTSLIKLNNDKHIGVPVPNATASCLNISHNCWVKAKELRENSNIDKSIKKQVAFNQESDAINYLELMMQSIIFAFTALEAFVNEIIPDDYVYEKQGQKCKEIYNKNEIERWLSIDEKIGQILPIAINVESPKGKHNSWNDLLKLKKIRDRLVHMKSADRLSSGPEKSTIWSELIKAEPPYRQAFSIVSYFIKKMQCEPRWYELSKSKLNK